MYFEPWLWYDGNQHGGYDFYLWEAMITSRMALPAPVTIRFWGEYTPTDGSGTVYAQFRNDSTAAINGCVLLVITEDSLFYAAPNGVMWHNHVPRDYLPDPNGTMVSIAPGDSVVVSQAFTTDAAWNDDKCKIIAYIQDTVIQADSTYEIWQGGMVDLTELGIAEQRVQCAVRDLVNVFPNPCRGKVNFSVGLPIGADYRITLYDVSGSKVTAIEGRIHKESSIVQWDRTDGNGRTVSPGVYFYEFVSTDERAAGKIVVR